MQFILKTLLENPSTRLLNDYRTKYASAFRDIDPRFDGVLDRLVEFHTQYNVFPSGDIFTKHLELDNPKQGEYLKGLLADPDVPTYNDAEFYLALDREVLTRANNNLQGDIASFSAALNKREPGVLGLVKPIDEAIAALQKTKARLNRGEESITSLLASGLTAEQAGHTLRDIYKRNKDQADTANGFYFDIGFEHFSKVRVKPGDVMFVGGFTSHGKSVLARYLTHRLVTYYGLNAAFFTREMSHDAVKVLFAILHANDKQRFPATPIIAYDAWQKGQLTDVEEDFLFGTAEHDLIHNPEYGSLFIEQPNKSRYRLRDMDQRLSELEMIMPVHVCVPDYLTMFYPLESDKGSPTNEDYNEMIKSFKQLCLTHQNARGETKPLIGISPAQISRKGMQEAVKNDNKYDIDAFARYSEIERSADILFTALMTPAQRAINQMRLQCHKNRDGEVVLDPLDIFIDLAHGFRLSEIQQQTQAQVVDALKTLQI
jgi:hypothetical protein